MVGPRASGKEIADGDPWLGPDSPLCQFIVRQSDLRLEGYKLNPGDIEEHAAIEQAVIDGGYGHRQLFELIQNAADAIRDSGGSGRVEVRLTPESLYCANEGTAVQEDGANSILRSHVSSKRSHEIGHFGLGFKSVLGISRHTEVFSRLGSFGFDSARARSQIFEHVPGYKGPTPGLRLAAPLDPSTEREMDPALSQMADWAATVIRLRRDLPRAEDLSKELEAFPAEFLLFSPHVSRLRIADHCIGQERPIELAADAVGAMVLNDGANVSSRWRVFRSTHPMSEEAKRDAGEATARDEVEIAWAVPLDRGGRGQYWAFFPTTYESTLTGILNAPWKTNSDRQGLLEGLYNTEIIEAGAKLVAKSLVALYNPAEPGAHLDLLPARPEDAEGWANRELTSQVYQQTGEQSVLPDSEGELHHPASLTLIPASAGESAIATWRQLEQRPSGWGHESINSRERRPRAMRLGAVSGGVDEWLRAIALPGTPMMSVAAISASEGCASEPKRYGPPDIAGRQAAIVLTAGGHLVPPDPAGVFLSGISYVEISDLNLVHPDVEADPEARRILTERFGLKQVDPALELQVLIAHSASPGFDSWERLWAASRRTQLEEAAPLLRKNRHLLRIRTLAGEWKRPWEVLLPGTIVPEDGSTEPSVAVDLAFHNHDREALGLIGVVSEPTSNGLTKEEVDDRFGGGRKWQYRYWDEATDAYHVLARQQTRSSPQSNYIAFQFKASAGPLTPFFALNDEAKIRFAAKLLPLALDEEAWSWFHKTRPNVYPSATFGSPAQWLICAEALINTTLGRRRVSECAGGGLARWPHVLPVAEMDGDFLHLPQQPGELSSEQLELAYAQALACIDFAEVSSFYGAIAIGGGSRPDRIRVFEPVGLINVPPDEVTVTHERAVADLLREDTPVLLVSTPEEAQALVAEWGLHPAEARAEIIFRYEVGGPSVPLTDAFPGLPADVLTEHGHVELVPCEALWREIRTTNGAQRIDLPIHFASLTSEVLYREGQPEDEMLRSLLSVLSVDLGEHFVARALRHNVEESQGRRHAEVRDLVGVDVKLAAMLGEEGLRRLLPYALLNEAEAGNRVLIASELARMALAVNGSATLIRYRDELERCGFNPPKRWAGGDGALRFVRGMGFPNEFAGAPARARPPFIEVDGPLILPALHDFQEKIASEIAGFLSETPPGRGLVSLPTGAGKTRVVTESLVRGYRDGALTGCVLWLADRGELCEQAVQSWREVWRVHGPQEPLRISRLWGDTNDRVEDVRAKHHVVVATFQSLVRRIEQKQFDWLTEAACVVIDEAHGSVTTSYTRILQQLELTARQTAKPLIGLTATPFRGRADDDGSETDRLVKRYGGRRFDRGVFENDDPYPLLRKMHVLSDAEFEVLEGTQFELTAAELDQFRQFDRLPPNVEVRLGLDRERNHRIVERVAKLEPEWPTLVFATSLDHAELLAALLAMRGITACAISSRTDQAARRHAIEQFKAGEIRVLTNYGVLTTGFDAPKTRALVITRPIYSPGLYVQVVGRGLRGPANGGTDSCLIINVEDNFLQYGNELAFRQFEHLWQRVRGEYY